MGAGMNNDQAGIVLLLVAVAAAVYFLGGSGSANAAVEDDSGDTGNDLSAVTTTSALDDLTGSLGLMDSNTNNNGYDANLSAFLYMLRMGESSNRYNVIYGGQTFSDYSHHPDVWVPIPSRPGYGSTAAGAYQFIFGTWNMVAGQAGVSDFSPGSQDAGAVQYLTDLGAMPYIEAGDVAGACAQINSTGVIFESLSVRSQSQLQAWYQGGGGALA
jgi:muramidase (phage lysozyme)